MVQFEPLQLSNPPVRGKYLLYNVMHAETIARFPKRPLSSYMLTQITPNHEPSNQLISHRESTSHNSLTLTPLILLLKNNLTRLSRQSPTSSTATISFTSGSLLIRSNKSVHSPMIQHTLLFIIFSLGVCLWPHISVQLAVSLASRATALREVGILLDEWVLAVLADNPGACGLSEEGGGEDVVARDADRWCMVDIGLWGW